MKLLFDENLSPKLVPILNDIFPGSLHVYDVGLSGQDDEAVWHYAREHNCIVVSKDSDFHEWNLLFGSPPKIIWLKKGNCSTKDIANLLRHQKQTIDELAQSKEKEILIIY